MVGNPGFRPRAFAILALAWLASGWFFFALPEPLRLRAIAFFLLAFLPLASAYLFVFAAGSLRAVLSISIGLSLAALPWFVGAALASGLATGGILGFWILLASLVFLAGGLSRRRTFGASPSAAGFPVAAFLLAAVIVGVWVSPFFDAPAIHRFSVALNPFAAAANLLDFDWIQDGELYFRSPSREPVGYPDWRVYAALAFLAGAAFLVWTWVRARKVGRESQEP